MNEVRVNKNELIEILTKNRAEHRDLFLEAQKKYRLIMVRMLDEELMMARNEQPFNVVNLVRVQAPQDHTADYDRALLMLRMSVDDAIVIDRREFTNFVQDRWGWSKGWADTVKGYVGSSAKLDMLSEEA